MQEIAFIDHRQDPGAWASRLGISRKAVDLYLACDVIDLHLDSFIWTRLFGYDLKRKHSLGLLGGWFFRQVDFPRLLEAQLSGSLWVITTNPLRGAVGRERAFFENLQDLSNRFAEVSGQFQLVETLAQYQDARRAGKHAVFLGIQGGNAVRRAESLDRRIVRVTLVHLSNSVLGATSSPLAAGSDQGLSAQGKLYVEELNDKRIFVDLAHISRKGFWDAVAVHNRALPLIVTHTGVCGVHPHWRNLDDRQIRAVAKSGGTIGIMYQSSFLGDRPWSGRAESVVDHVQHVIQVVGDDYVSLGSDWDGTIIPPSDLRSPTSLPRLVQIMLDRGFSELTIAKVLAGNFLRALRELRGSD